MCRRGFYHGNDSFLQCYFISTHNSKPQAVATKEFFNFAKMFFVKPSSNCFGRCRGCFCFNSKLSFGFQISIRHVDGQNDIMWLWITIPIRVETIFCFGTVLFTWPLSSKAQDNCARWADVILPILLSDQQRHGLPEYYFYGVNSFNAFSFARFFGLGYGEVKSRIYEPIRSR